MVMLICLRHATIEAELGLQSDPHSSETKHALTQEPELDSTKCLPLQQPLDKPVDKG